MVIINRVAKVIRNVILVSIIPIFGLIILTKEYNGSEGKIGWKNIFDYSIKINLSVLLIVILGIIIILTILSILIYFTDIIINIKSERQKSDSEKENIKVKYCQAIEEKIKNETKTKILEVMDDIMANYSEIIAVQLFEYITCTENHNTIYDVKPTNYFRLRNAQSVNLIHERYTIKSELIYKYKKSIEYLKKGNYDFIAKYIKELKDDLVCDENCKKVNDTTVIKYSLFILLMQHYLKGKTYKIYNLFTETFIHDINEYKRMGFLKGILFDNYYKFIHERSSCKGERVYVTKCLPIENRDHIFTIVFDADIIYNTDYDDYIDEIGEMFYKTLSERTNLVYNNVKRHSKGVL